MLPLDFVWEGLNLDDLESEDLPFCNYLSSGGEEMVKCLLYVIETLAF